MKQWGVEDIMVATEIFLIAAGVICVVVSVVMSFGDDKENHSMGN